jgi:hypothetical protein
MCLFHWQIVQGGWHRLAPVEEERRNESGEAREDGEHFVEGRIEVEEDKEEGKARVANSMSGSSSTAVYDVVHRFKASR